MTIAMRAVFWRYEDCLQQMKHTTSARKIERLETRRCDLHNQLLDMLRSDGIEISHRDDAYAICKQMILSE